MNDNETSVEHVENQPSRAKTFLWLSVGLAVYVLIQWALPKVGVPT